MKSFDRRCFSPVVRKGFHFPRGWVGLPWGSEFGCWQARSITIGFGSTSRPGAGQGAEHSLVALRPRLVRRQAQPDLRRRLRRCRRPAARRHLQDVASGPASIGPRTRFWPSSRLPSFCRSRGTRSKTQPDRRGEPAAARRGPAAETGAETAWVGRDSQSWNSPCRAGTLTSALG